MPVTRVLLDILVVLLAAKLAAELAERARLPAVVGEIVAGILIGPSAVGLVRGDDVLRTLGELGVILLLFDVGLEMDLAELGTVGRAALSVAGVGVSVSFAAGAGAGLALGLSGKTALFVGAAITATSVGITARVFGDLRALGTREARTVIGAAIADDVIGLVVLTVVARLATNGSVAAGSVLGVIGVALAFLALTTAIGVRTAPLAFGFVARVSRSSGTLVAVALAFTLAVSELASAARLAPIIGAFVAGVALGRSTSADRVRRELTPVGHLFIPVFFLQIGIDAKLRVFAHPHVLALASVLLGAAVLGKMAAALGMGRSPGDRLLIGLGMMPRGEVSLIFATLGLREHIFGDDVYAAILLVILATTLGTPALLRWRLRTTRTTAGARPPTSPAPPGGWLQASQGGVIDLAGEPPLTAALPVALEAAVLCDQHRPGSRLLDWLSGLPDAPLRWDSRARAAFFVLLERGGPRAWRFLSLTGVLDRALPELGAVLARRQADPFELDATGALRWPRLARVLELQGRAQLEHPERVALAAVILDATEDEPPDQTVVIARRLIGRLGLGAAVEQSVAGLVTDAGLLAAAARRIDAFSEEKVLALAVHLGNSEQARALYLLTVASGTADDPIDQRRVAELHQLVQAALARPELTGREASNAVSQRQAEAIRLVRDEAVKERITAAPRAYVLATPPDAIARHAALCEPLPRSDEVRVAVAPPPGGATVEVVARDRVGLLARVAGVLAGRGLDIRAATIATWGDGCALASLGVDGEPPSGTDLAAAITTALHHPPVPHPFPHVQLTFDDQGSPWHTLCRAEGPDRPGLLHALTAAFAVAGASVHAARIGSVGGVATDEFELTDRHGHKLTPAMEATIRSALERGATPRRAWYAPWRPSRPARNGAATEAFTKTKQTSDKRATTEP